ncbi:hypothetical protein J6590_003238 [Homalodisca vitripennis]|nr:hypothetical protein J6590_098064 [Homalodisca vitripennis]KAG8294069.1 hypothetical protein J6590_003238 [Homalodisca vitripennis]
MPGRAMPANKTGGIKYENLPSQWRGCFDESRFRVGLPEADQSMDILQPGRLLEFYSCVQLWLIVETYPTHQLDTHTTNTTHHHVCYCIVHVWDVSPPKHPQKQTHHTHQTTPPHAILSQPQGDDCVRPSGHHVCYCIVHVWDVSAYGPSTARRLLEFYSCVQLWLIVETYPTHQLAILSQPQGDDCVRPSGHHVCCCIVQETVWDVLAWRLPEL